MQLDVDQIRLCDIRNSEPIPGLLTVPASDNENKYVEKESGSEEHVTIKLINLRHLLKVHFMNFNYKYSCIFFETLGVTINPVQLYIKLFIIK